MTNNKEKFVGESFLINEIHFNTSKADYKAFWDFTDKTVYFMDQICP